MVTEQMWNGFARQSLAEFVSNCPSVCQRLLDRNEDARIGWQHQRGPRRLSISTGIMPPDARVRGSADSMRAPVSMAEERMLNGPARQSLTVRDAITGCR